MFKWRLVVAGIVFSIRCQIGHITMRIIAMWPGLTAGYPPCTQHWKSFLQREKPDANEKYANE